MDLDLKCTQTTLFSKGTFLTGRSTAGVEVLLQPVKFIKDRFRMTLCAETACSSGQTVDCTTVPSKAAKRTEKASTCGQTASFMKENSKMTTAMDLALCTIQTARSTKAFGKTVKSMAKVCTFGQTVLDTFVYMQSARKRYKASWKALRCHLNSLRARTATFRRDQQMQRNI